jgi:hypothetical protein
MNNKKHVYSKAWKLARVVQFPVQKVLQASGVHKVRGPYLLGHLNREKYSEDAIEKHLHEIGFEPNKLAWCEPGEVLSLRKVDGHKFQWHIRVFEDGEVRGHYETAPEGNVIKHFTGDTQDDSDFLKSLLGDYII